MTKCLNCDFLSSGLFGDATNVTGYTTSNDRVTGDGIGKEARAEVL